VSWHFSFASLSVFEFSFKKKKSERLTLIITKELKTAGLSFMYANFFCVWYDKLMTGPVRTLPAVFLLGFRKKDKKTRQIFL
jgi:hypothetical protein